MVNANELRIGNWITEEILGRVEIATVAPNQVIVLVNHMDVDRKESKKNITLALSEIKGIPLTAELLEKAGFILTDDGISPYHKLVLNRTEAISIEDDFSFGLNAENENSKMGFASHPDLVKYVHQLQNLYFALTGTELTINL